MVKRFQLGQSILEAIFAIAITGMILAGFVSAIIFFGRTSQVAQSGAEATQLAQEKIEQLRADRKRSPSDFWQKLQEGGFNDEEAIKKYNRTTEVNLEQENGNIYRAKVKVTIAWIDQGEDKEVNMSTYFSKY